MVFQKYKIDVTYIATLNLVFTYYAKIFYKNSTCWDRFKKVLLCYSSYLHTLIILLSIILSTHS